MGDNDNVGLLGHLRKGEGEQRWTRRKNEE
jgi:hypothetical protein